MTSAAAGRAEKIHPLTSLRFFAALLVVLFHTLPKGVPGLSAGSLGGRTVSMGYVSVSFFFLLSGYILAIVYLRGGKPLDRRKFWAARFARVYPLFFAMLVLDTPPLLTYRIATYGLRIAVLKTSATFAANTVMLQGWVPSLRGIDNPNWSLSVETVFYLVFPFIGVSLWKLRGARIWLAALPIYLGGQALVWAGYPHVSDSHLKFHPLFHLSTFALGILLARWQVERQQRQDAPPVRPWQVYALLTLGAAAFTCVVYASGRIPDGFLYDGLLAPVFACAVWGFSSADTWISRLFSLPWLVVLGEASYGLYLIHIPVRHVFERFHLERIQATYPAYLGACIGLSVLSFYYFETPVRKWLLRRLAVKPRETMEQASDAQ